MVSNASMATINAGRFDYVTIANFVGNRLSESTVSEYRRIDDKTVAYFGKITYQVPQPAFPCPRTAERGGRARDQLRHKSEQRSDRHYGQRTHRSSDARAGSSVSVSRSTSRRRCLKRGSKEPLSSTSSAKGRVRGARAEIAELR